MCNLTDDNFLIIFLYDLIDTSLIMSNKRYTNIECSRKNGIGVILWLAHAIARLILFSLKKLVFKSHLKS